MSVSAASRLGPARPRTAPTPTRSLRAVAGTAGAPGNARFAALSLGILMMGFISLLMLNTALAQGSFDVAKLQAQVGELQDTEVGLQVSIDQQSSPAVLAQRAAALGMVPARTAAFLRLSDGKILGIATPAVRVPGFTILGATTTTPSSPQVRPATPAKATTVTTVTKHGVVTTTTTVTHQPDGTVITVVTSVNAKTHAVTTVRTVTPPPAKPAAAKPAATKPAAAPPTKPTTKR